MLFILASRGRAVPRRNPGAEQTQKEGKALRILAALICPRCNNLVRRLGLRFTGEPGRRRGVKLLTGDPGVAIMELEFLYGDWGRTDLGPAAWT